MRGDAASGSGAWFWMVGPALFLASLSGWLPAQRIALLLLLIVLANHLGGAPAGLTFLLPPDRILSVAAIALALGHLLSRFPREAAWAARLREGAQALAGAAVGLILIGIAMVSVHTLGLGGGRPTFMVAFAFIAITLAALVLARFRMPARATSPVSDLLVLGAAALALLVWMVTGSSHDPSTFWTVWGGIVPALMLVVAGDLEDRRELYGWGLALTAGLTLSMLAASRNLIAFSGNLMLCALLVTLALVACRRAGRSLDRKAA